MSTAIQPQNQTMVIQQYGESSEIMSLAKRIKIMVPGGNKLTDAEAQALAQVSLVTRCNPFIGEIWYIPGRGPMIGIKGARRHGNERIEDAGGPQAYWTVDLQPCSPEEAGAKDVKNVAAAYRGVLTDSVSTALYQKMFLETINALRAAGSKDPVGDAREICGKKPQWIGYGYSTVDEQSKMNKQSLAMKRTEADAIKRRFDIPFGTDVAAGDNASDTGDWIDAPALEVANDTEKRTVNQNVKELGFTPADVLDIPEEAPAIQMYRYNDGVIMNAVKNVLNYSVKEAAEVIYQAFKAGKIGEKLTVDEAREFATALIAPK